jgi:hypothetical protein
MIKNKTAKFNLVENISIKLLDAQGNAKKLFQPYKLVAWAIKHGILSPYIRQSFLTGYFTKTLHYQNLVVSAGKAGIASRINGAGSEAVFTYIAIGTGATAAAAGNTTLGTEITTGGGGRTNGTASRVTTTVTNDTARTVANFTFSSSFAITETGLLNASSAGTLLNRSVFSAINVVSTDTLQMTIDISVA